MKNYYEILEVNKLASKEVIDKAYKVLVKKYHPDTQSGKSKTFYETKPETVLEVEVCKKSGFLASNNCKSYRTSYTEYFVPGTEPIQTCPYHSYAKVCKESGMLATDNCPSTRSVYGRGEYIQSNDLWKTRSYNYKPTNIPLEACTIH